MYDFQWKDDLTSSVMGLLSEKEERMISLMKEGKSENFIAKKLYNQTRSGSSYKYLREGLIKKMQQLVSVSSNNGNNIQKIKEDIFQKLFVVKKMDLFGMRQAIEPLAISLHDKALKYQCYEELVEVSKWLCIHFSAHKPDNKKFETYHNSLLEGQERVAIEFKAQIKFCQCAQMITKDQSVDLGAASIIQSYADEIEKQLKEDSHRSYFYYALMRHFQFIKEGNRSKNIDLHKNCIQYLHQLPFTHNLAIQLFQNQLIDLYIEDGKLAQAELLIESCLKDYKKTSQHRIRLLEIQIKLKLAMCKFEDALGILEIMDKRSIKYQYKQYLRHNLVLYNFYALIMLGHLSKVKMKSVVTHLNHYKEDKSGKYIALLIGQLIFYIVSGDEGKIIDKAEALNMYCRTHLNQKENHRAYVFIRNLIAIVHGRPLKKLPSKNGQADGIELVPYEVLQKKAKNVLEGQHILWS